MAEKEIRPTRVRAEKEKEKEQAVGGMVSTVVDPEKKPRKRRAPDGGGHGDPAVDAVMDHDAGMRKYMEQVLGSLNTITTQLQDISARVTTHEERLQGLENQVSSLSMVERPGQPKSAGRGRLRMPGDPATKGYLPVPGPRAIGRGGPMIRPGEVRPHSPVAGPSSMIEQESDDSDEWEGIWG